MTPPMKESAINLRNAYGEFIAAADLSSIRIGSEQFSKNSKFSKKRMQNQVKD